MQLEIKFEKYENVRIETFFEDLKEIREDGNSWSDSYVFIDELDISGLCSVGPEDLNQIKVKSIWMVVRQTTSGEIDETTHNPQEHLEVILPSWLIINLNYPLRLLMASK